MEAHNIYTKTTKKSIKPIQPKKNKQHPNEPRMSRISHKKYDSPTGRGSIYSRFLFLFNASTAASSDEMSKEIVKQ